MAQERNTPGASKCPALRWMVPADFPTGIETVIAGRLTGSTDKPPQLVRFRAGGGDAGLAQRDARNGTFLWIDSIDRQSRGKKIEVRVSPDDGKKTVAIREQADRFEFRDGDRTVMFYQRKEKSLDGKSPRANYVHPLYGLDGEELTQDFPADHIHHRGIFWAWHQNIVGGKSAGDSWVNQDLRSVVRRADIVDEGPVFATLEVVVDWMSSAVTDSEGKPQAIVEESTRIRLYRATAQHQYVDFEIRLKPLFDNVLIGGAENERGYSGFTARLRPPRDIVINDETGRHEKDAVGTKSKWADVTGKFGKDDAVSGVAILSHPSLAEFPPKWLLRNYGMQNVVYPGRHPVALSAKKPLVLRHRLVLHRGDAKTASVAAHQRAYEHLP